jgi:hypothetical protein
VLVALIALAVAGATAQQLGDAPIPRPTRAPGDFILMPRSELMGLPTSGSAWTYLVETARSTWPPPDINDQNSQVDTLAFGAALVAARTGDDDLRTKAHDAIMAVIPTFETSRLGPGLGPLRQTAGWVLAADLIGLDGADDAQFRTFLERILSEPTGTHSRWDHVVTAHDDASNNWGAWAGAARIAATLYLDGDVGEAANTVRGFLGDRASWSQFNGQKDALPSSAAPWACSPSQATFTPVNGPCTLAGLDLDGAIPVDISRGGGAPPDEPSTTGIMYTLETLAGYLLQVELLYRNGYPEMYDVQSQAIRRIADFVSRTEAAGGPGWNPGRVQNHIPWLLNARYDTTYPTVPAEYGRSFGFTDWLYGGAAQAPPSPVTSPTTQPGTGAPGGS